MTRQTRTIGSPDATRAVDWEQRVDFPRLRQDRLDRAKASLEASDLGAVLLFDPNNIRYVTSTHIGEWARDKNARFALLRGAEPILWDFGSAARHHQLFAPWPARRTSAPVSRRCAARCPSRPGSRTGSASGSRTSCASTASRDEPLGVDMADLVTIEALQRAGVHVTDGSQVLLEARKIKTAQEISLLDQSPGSSTRSTRRSTGCYGRACTSTRSSRAPTSCCSRWDRAGRRSTPSRATAAIRTRTCSPTGSCGRATRRSSTSSIRSWATGRATTARSTSAASAMAQLDAYKQCREWLDAAIELVRPGMTTDRIAEVWPTAEELGFPDEETCFGLQFGHGSASGSTSRR